jgi:hypothetical protein
LFGLARIVNKDEPINQYHLANPLYPVTNLILYIYTMESFIFRVLNESTRNADESKITTMGPYARVLGYVIQHASRNRSDFETFRFQKEVELYRGLALTKDEI